MTRSPFLVPARLFGLVAFVLITPREVQRPCQNLSFDLSGCFSSVYVGRVSLEWVAAAKMRSRLKVSLFESETIVSGMYVFFFCDVLYTASEVRFREP
jgi:hypothetical protein